MNLPYIEYQLPYPFKSSETKLLNMLFFYKNVLVFTKSTSFFNNDFFRNQQRETFKTDQKYSNAVSSSRVKWWSSLGENAQWKNACSFTSFSESSTRYLSYAAYLNGFCVGIYVETFGMLMQVKNGQNCHTTSHATLIMRIFVDSISNLSPTLVAIHLTHPPESPLT